MAIVWPCPLSVDAYAAAGRKIEVPRGHCPSCAEELVGWSGYWRHVRHEERTHRIWVPRGRCRACRATHALLPAFLLRNRLDSVETIGSVIGSVAAGRSGARPAAAASGVPHTTARGWVRRFAERAASHAVSFAALAVELGGVPLSVVADPVRRALVSMAAAVRAASGLPGWRAAGGWRFCSAVGGGTLLAANTNSPYLVVGRRRFMPPVR